MPHIFGWSKTTITQSAENRGQHARKKLALADWQRTKESLHQKIYESKTARCLHMPQVLLNLFNF